MTEKRKTDIKVEREVAKFLDENLYATSSIFSDYTRTDNKEEQLQGSDVILTTFDTRVNRAIVDEKVAARYANKNLKTFSLEISFLGKNGNERVGWLIDEDKTTEYYLCGWITKANIPYDEENDRFQTELITKDNILQMDWALVSRNKIMSHLEEMGWPLEKIKLQSNKIRENGGVQSHRYINGVTFRYSEHLVEKPINILMWKQTYFNLADYSGTIKINPDGSKEWKQTIKFLLD